MADGVTYEERPQLRRPYDVPGWRERASRRMTMINKMPRGPEFREKVADITRSNWLDADVRERRSLRHKCQVNGVVYPSVRAAFRALHLDDASHTTVRKQMVRDGAVQYGGFFFYAQLV
jgi:hypothetical protein